MITPPGYGDSDILLDGARYIDGLSWRCSTYDAIYILDLGKKIQFTFYRLLNNTFILGNSYSWKDDRLAQSWNIQKQTNLMLIWSGQDLTRKTYEGPLVGAGLNLTNLGKSMGRHEKPANCTRSCSILPKARIPFEKDHKAIRVG